MAKRRKNRTHVKTNDNVDSYGAPRSFVIKHGQVGASLTQLVRDMRKVMEPNTASRLKERSRNKLKDFIVMAPVLQVTHLLAFTLTDIAPSMRLVRLPAGPSLSFRVERYSLMKDILNATRRARSMGMEYLTPPLLVLASFPSPSPTTPPHLTLLMKSFQSLFPPLSPQMLSLSNARRIVLVAYNAERGTIDFRHYLITVKPYGVSKRVRRVLEGATASKSTSSSKGFLDLGDEKDVADFVLRKRGEPGPGGDGYESAASSASSAAGDDGEPVSLADDYVGRNNKKGSKRAVRLDEIGPRMELRLVKIAEGLPGKEGSVIYHEFVKKTKAEAVALKAAHATKEKLRKERKQEQERNVQRKKKLEQGSEIATDEEASSEDENDDWNEGAWDDNEEISDDEESEDEIAGEESGSDDEEPERPPPKKVKFKQKR